MKTRFFLNTDPGLLKKAVIRILIATLFIAISIPGHILSKGNSLFAILYFTGFVLLFYSILYPWLKASYYTISIAIFLVLIILFSLWGINIFVSMEKAGKIHVHGAEDYAWAIGSIFIAGIIAGIIGIFRSRMFKNETGYK
jgi:hypothetical protein